MIKRDPLNNDFQKEQMIKVLTNQENEWNEDEFLNQFPPDIQNFLIEHFPYPIPKYLKKISIDDK
jgi:hypothetical protein